jgi:hypothetical protein
VTSPSKKPFTILAFPAGQMAWRIDWFGSVAFPDRMLRRKQPSIFVYLSQVPDQRFLNDPSFLLDPKSTDATQNQRGCWVSVGTLPLLQIGDIWQDQKLLLRADYQLESFGDLQIDSTTTKLIKAGLNPNEKGFLLPLSEHPWHRRSTQSYCLEVALSDNKRIIIPCVELIRFYFGSSSGLLTQLFLPPLTKNKLCTRAYFDSAQERLTLELADKISGTSAADIGRLHRSSHAWRAALTIGTSLLRGKALGQEIHPQTFFPFEGKTDLVASGKWLSFAGMPNSTFVVYSLRSCSHPFPFKSLRYEIKNKDAHITKDRSEYLMSKSPQSAATQHLGARDSANQNLKEQDASNQLTSKTWFFSAEARFPDLIQKPVWKSKSLVPADANQKMIGSGAPEVEAAAIGESGSNHRIRSVELAMLNKQKERKPPPEFMRAFVDDLGQLRGVEITLLTASDEDGWTVPITAIHDGNGEIDARLFIQINNELSRLRRIALITVNRNIERVSIVVIEAEPMYAQLYIATGQNLEEIWQILTRSIMYFLMLPAGDDLIIEQLNWIFGTQ